MKVAVGYLHRCLVRRPTVAFVTTAFGAAPASLSSKSARATHRHITSFKGHPREFLNEVNSEKVALVYFYAPWCEPCNRAHDKLEALLSRGCPTARGGPEVTSSTVCASSSSEEEEEEASPSKVSAAEAPLQPRAVVDPQSRVDPEALLKSAQEVFLRARTNGTAVRVIPVNTDENPKLGALHDIRSVPTFVTYRDGRIVGRVEGSSDEQIRQVVKELLQEDDGDTSADDGTNRMRNSKEYEEANKQE